MTNNFKDIKFTLCKDLMIPEHPKILQNKSSLAKLKSPKDLVTLSGLVLDGIELPVQFKWTTEDVSLWIRNLGFSQYQNSFETNFINGRKLILVDASALAKMNITNFDHVCIISKEIRKMFKTHVALKNPETYYKFFKSSTGPTFERIQETEYLQKMNLMKVAKIPLNHFEVLHKWLKHVPDSTDIRIANIRRVNLFYVKPSPNHEIEPQDVPICHCEMPPCECNWSKKEKKKPWRLSSLVQAEMGKYSEKICGNFEKFP